MSIRDPFSLTGKTALVAGASRGIGLAIAEALARAGAHVILASRSLDKLESAAARLRESGASVETRRLDVADSASVQECTASPPDVDVLVNVAGMNIRKRFESFTPAEYEKLMATNLRGLFELTQQVGRRMVARGKGGKIINVGSLTSMLGLPYVAVYAISKSALAGMTRALAAEWGRHGIQVNLIAPGFILTDLTQKLWASKPMLDWLMGAQAIPRMGTPEDLGPLAVFLAGSGSDYVTGQTIAVDGGYSTTATWPFEPPAE